MSDRFTVDGHVRVQRLVEAADGGFWNVHCDTIGSVVKLAYAAREVLENPSSLAMERLDEALDWFDFADDADG